MNIVGIIPARYDSTRLPGKPLKKIGDKTLIMRVYDQCMMVDLFKKVVVATDDERIFRHVQDSGGEAIMTSKNHGSGTERCNEAIGKIEGDFDFVINVQGDEPFINPNHIKTLISGLNKDIDIATLSMPIIDSVEVEDVNIPKVVVNKNGDALYFSRSVIPHIRKGSRSDDPYFKHIGIYAYRKDILATIVDLPPSNIETAEQLEQLRWLYNALRIRVISIPNERCISVDTELDLENARKIAADLG